MCQPIVTYLNSILSHTYLFIEHNALTGGIPTEFGLLSRAIELHLGKPIISTYFTLLTNKVSSNAKTIFFLP